MKGKRVMFGGSLIDMLIPAEERAGLMQAAAGGLERLQRAEMAVQRIEHKTDLILRAVVKLAEKQGVPLTDDAALITDATIVSESTNARAG